MSWDSVLGLGGGVGNTIFRELRPGGLINTAISSGSKAVTSLTNNKNDAIVKSQSVIDAVTGVLSGLSQFGEASSMPGGSYNVLNDYRSYTYQWTLACLGKNALKNPKSYKKSSLDYIVARSGGKNLGMTVPKEKTKVAPAKQPPNSTSTQYEEPVDTIALVTDFNNTSPGRFDLFIDNVDLECILAPGEKQGNSVATNIKFDVLEPYSLNGYIEALYVAAVSAGYDGYVGSPFILKLEFWGYPDSDLAGEPQLVPNSSRYFVFTFTEVNITVTEQGTKYSCSGVPSNELAFSLPDELMTDIKMEGETVAKVLTNLFDNINASTKERALKEKSDATSDDYDEYEIYFPPAVTGYPSPAYKLDSTTQGTASESEIAKATMANFLTNNAVIKMIEPEKKAKPAGGTKGATTATPGDTGSADKPQDQGMKYEPNKSVIQFAQGAHISDIITAVIRDSNYLVDIIKDVKKAADKNGMITYFMIQINVVPKNKDDSASGRPLNKYQYVVVPWKVHFSKLSLQKNVTYDPGTLDDVVNREYHYFYTGKNVDIVNFSIKFNNLFYQATPPKSGNTENQEQASASVPNGEDSAKKTNTSSKQTAKQQNGTVPEKPSSEAASVGVQTQAGAKRTDPYLQFAQATHKAIMESVDQIEGEIEIIGDPFYLVMGGIGNDIPDLTKPGLTSEGTADHQGGQVMIKLNFNNPIDYDEQTGEMLFRKDVSYSGVYNVLEVKSHFKDGKFSQHLKILRMSGQISDSDKDVVKEEPVKLSAKPKPGGSPTKDTATGVDRAGARPSALDLTKLLDRGIPSPGLPGNLSDFTNGLNNAVGSLGVAGGLLASAKGAVGGLGLNLGGKVGLSLDGLNPLTSGIKLPTLPQVPNLADAGNVATANTLLSSAAGAAQNISTVPTLSVDVSTQASALASKLSSGALSSADPASVIPSVNNLTSIANNVGGNAMAQLSSVANPAGFISGAQSKIDALTKGLPSDPTAAAANLGLDPSALAGLDPSLQSKVMGQLADVTKNLPTDVDMDTLKKSGVSLANISGGALQNIPSTAKKIVDQGPDLPDTKINSAQGAELLKQAEDNIAKLGGGANIDLGGGLSLAKLKASLPVVPGLNAQLPGLSGVPGLDKINAVAGQLGSAQNLLGNVTGSLPSVEGALATASDLTGGQPLPGIPSVNDLSKSVTSKFGSLTASASPLTKFMNSQG